MNKYNHKFKILIEIFFLNNYNEGLGGREVAGLSGWDES